MNVYRTVYDIQQAGCRDGFLPFWALACFAIAWALPYKATVGSKRAILIFFRFVALLSALLTWGDYWTLVQREKSGRVQTVEGVVHDFREAPDSKAEESFAVGNKRLSYKTYAVKQGFNTLRMNGGPIRDGARVMVTIFGDQIVRLEME